MNAPAPARIPPGSAPRSSGGWMSPKMTTAFGQLSSEERAALYLRDVEQKPLEAVAGELGCSPQDARLRIAHGRIKLLRYFETAA